MQYVKEKGTKGGAQNKKEPMKKEKEGGAAVPPVYLCCKRLVKIDKQKPKKCFQFPHMSAKLYISNF